MSPKYKPGQRVKIGDNDVQVPECYGDCDTTDAECGRCVVTVECAADTAPPESKTEKKSRRKPKPPVEKTEENSKSKPTRRSRRKSKAQTGGKLDAPPVAEKPSRRKKKDPPVEEKSEAPKPSRRKPQPPAEKKSRKKTVTKSTPKKSRKKSETKAPEKKSRRKPKPPAEKKSRKKTVTKSTPKPSRRKTKAPEKKSRKKSETKAPEKKKSVSKPKSVDGDGPSRRWRPPTGGKGGFFYTLTEGERAIAEELVGHIEGKPFIKVEHYHDRVNIKGPSHHGFLKLFDLQVINGRLEANMRTPSQELVDLATEKGFEVTDRAHESFGFPLLTKKLGLAFRQLIKLRLEEMVPVHKRT